ncbi:hypothetical protein [Neisseria polysaccharea]|uniref:hypothetical protein n=1 Tax=Neisseria polysaccharea TaxID=489 RepID=UPI0027DFCF49|nr:hypothetical protein [Neisseria polysaccharea]
MKANIYTIPVKFDIWDTQYTITDHGDRLSIECPCRKYERGNSQSWGLGYYTETVTHPNQIALIRKMVESGRARLSAKNSMASFSVEEVIFGMPNAYGFIPEDFD